MLKKWFLLIYWLPHVAFGAELTLAFNNITENHFLPVSATEHRIFSTLIAKQRISHHHRQAWLLSYRQSTAKKLLQYKFGKLVFPTAVLHFDSAYYHRGKMILEKVHGEVEGVKLSAKMLTYDPKRWQISSRHIVLADNQRLTVKKRFSHNLITAEFNFARKAKETDLLMEQAR